MEKMLKGKTVIVGVTGSIAAYKSCEIISRLRGMGAEVRVVMTDEAAKLVGPLTFRALSGNPVITDLFSEEFSSLPVPHISLAEKADLILLAPCTANIIGKIANGIADDALTTIVMAATARKVIAPAMNGNMWKNLAVKKNVETLTFSGYEFVGPVEGKLACGDEDIGRMAEPEKILEKIEGILSRQQDLQGMSILITAGGTREAIDPVRFIGNRSSGKMGYALAESAKLRGADVTLISGPTQLFPPAGVKVLKVVSAKEMHEAVMENREGQKVIIMAAAVADYRPSITFWQKFKKAEDTYHLQLLRTVDILTELGKNKNGTRLVGFAAETHDHLDNAREKMEKKNLDMIVVNDASAFEEDASQVQIMDKRGGVESLPLLQKSEAANRILDAILRL